MSTLKLQFCFGIRRNAKGLSQVISENGFLARSLAGWADFRLMRIQASGIVALRAAILAINFNESAKRRKGFRSDSSRAARRNGLRFRFKRHRATGIAPGSPRISFFGPSQVAFLALKVHDETSNRAVEFFLQSR